MCGFDSPIALGLEFESQVSPVMQHELRTGSRDLLRGPRLHRNHGGETEDVVQQ